MFTKANIFLALYEILCFHFLCFIRFTNSFIYYFFPFLYSRGLNNVERLKLYASPNQGG